MNQDRPEIRLSALARNPAIEKLLKSLGEGPVDLAGLRGDAPGFVVSLLCETPRARVLRVGADGEQCEREAVAVSSIRGTRAPVFPSRGMEKNRSLFEKREITEPERIHSLVRWKETGVLFAEAAALFEATAPAADFEAESFSVETGAEIGRDALVERLSRIGYGEAEFTERRGQMSVRGAIVDLFSPGAELPARVEFFDDRVNSVREFSPSTQKSTGKIRAAAVAPASFAFRRGKNTEDARQRLLRAADERGLTSSETEPLLRDVEQGRRFRGEEWFAPFFWKRKDCLLDYPPEDLIVVFPGEFDPARTLERLREKFESRKGSLGALSRSLPPFEELYLAQDELEAKLAGKKVARVAGVAEAAGQGSVLRFSTGTVSFREPSVAAFAEEAQNLAAGGYDVFVFFSSRKEREKFEKLSEGRPRGRVAHVVGELFESTALHDFRTALLTEKNLFEKTAARAPAWKADDAPSAFLTSFASLRPGDHVVHRECGVGTFRGLRRLSFGGKTGEFLECEYRDGDKVFVPVEKADLVQKYAGGGSPRVEKLGSPGWKRTVGRVARAVERVAEDLVELYAERKLEKGFRFSPRDRTFGEFEMAFPWSETPDQASAIEDVMRDMESERPMDRLICGDVGFGKTEVALRAAFKAALDGKQVMLLAPTTLLASQHHSSALERLDGCPVRVEALSRFVTGKKEKEILRGLEDGSVDIAIGTHKLLGKRIRFRNLGLVIIDEEQKFGVAHKKAIRALRKGVDVLTLSATPIPRTLQLSLADVSDISVINTPPEGRQPVEVYVREFSPGAVRDAAEKEIARGGTVFFVHNRIEDIFEKARFVKELLPEASVGVAHGRMGERELSKTMGDFAAGRTDVLVTTAIVESGLDIPRANTIVVNDAHAMGLADLYQLKGRVGRSDVKAYAHFLVPSAGSLTGEARKRLEVLSRLTDLGSGFKLALSDLEIRGAGTLFGKEQSGHVADVGLEFYLELLNDAVRAKKEGKKRLPEKPATEIKTPDDAFIPRDYMESGSERLLCYKRISSARERGEIRGIAEETEDRFGPMPEEFRRLVLVAELRLELADKFVRKAEVRKTEATLVFARDGATMRVPLPAEGRYEALLAAAERVEKPRQNRIVQSAREAPSPARGDSE